MFVNQCIMLSYAILVLLSFTFLSSLSYQTKYAVSEMSYSLFRHFTFLSLVPHTGPTDEEWRSTLQKYAMGQHKFSTGQRPRKGKWKAVLKQIEDCPLTPRFHMHTVRYSDVFGKPIKCTCGYHKVSKIDSSGCKVY